MTAAGKALAAIVVCAAALAAQTPAERSWKQKIAAANQLLGQGNHAEAERIFLDVVEEAGTLSPRNPLLAAALNDLGYCYQDLGKAAEAERLFRRAARIWEQAEGQHEEDLLICLNNLAGLYVEARQYGKAEALLRGSITERAAALEPNHPQRGYIARNLGKVYCTRRRFADAEPLLLQSLAVLDRNFGPDHPEVAAAVNNLGALYLSTGRRAEAQAHFERALAILESWAKPDTHGLATTLANLSILAGLEQHWEVSKGYLNRALALVEKAFGPEDVLVGEILWHQAAMLRKMQRKREAKETETRAREILALWPTYSSLHHTIDITELSAGRDRGK